MEPWLYFRSGRGPLAQRVEQGTLNPKVAGSSPARPTSPRPGETPPGRRELTACMPANFE